MKVCACRNLVLLSAVALRLAWAADAVGQIDPLATWNDGAAKEAIIAFVKTTTDGSSAKFVPPAARISAFDQDGTLWVEHPIYAQVVYCLDRVPVVVKEKPELARKEPFKTVLTGNRAAIAKLSPADLVKILAATLTGMSVDKFQDEVKAWLDVARDPRWQRPYTEVTYLPMVELLKYLRANGFKTYIVTGGGQDFVHTPNTSMAFRRNRWSAPPAAPAMGMTAMVVRSLPRNPGCSSMMKRLASPEGIHLMIGRRPYVAFGNSTGDRQMLEYTKAGDETRLAMLVPHDDARREYAYGPARGLPDSKIGKFTQVIYDEAQKQGWVVISMKNDWRRVFAFEH